MQPQITDQAWKKLAGEIQGYWSGLSAGELSKAKRGAAKLRKILRQKYLLAPAEVDAQIKAFIDARGGKVPLAMRATPRM